MGNEIDSSLGTIPAHAYSDAMRVDKATFW